MKIFDLIGIGFGPANLALAVAMQEQAETITSPLLNLLFLEAKTEFAWHPGMLLENMSIQVSFLKDLATLRNPQSHFTFLNYLKSKGRLNEFINLRTFYPTRREINDYFRWAAKHFENQVSYERKVIDLQPVSLNQKEEVNAIQVMAQNLHSGQTESYLARNLVIATGGKPKIPDGVEVNCQKNSNIFHSSEFLYRCQKYDNFAYPYRFVVVGSGQSAAEIFDYLGTHYPNAQVIATLRSLGYKPINDSSFVNEIFFPKMVDLFYNCQPENREKILEDYHDTNYSVVDPDLIQNIYKLMYAQKVRGDDRLQILPSLHLDSAVETEGVVRANFTNTREGTKTSLQSDALILATGYDHSNRERLLQPLSNYLLSGSDGSYDIKRNYCLKTVSEFTPKIFLQGLCENSHGLSDTLLSLLSIRASEILEELRETLVRDNSRNGKLLTTNS
ncbi:MAG: monooxygenase [Microcystis panniformis Mp_MB_F_20051200_S9]|uniref:L-lysine N6-monooxygenase MbtG n=1 Tax=Microcystis panniformis Mp_MB_F_20051200_S9 TaxID=2486223 RepID=A0A552Q3C0_9CHRO|nr:MAG: monooxygenase [Microcystis panniformis Mp_GB_SS_20050300_S99D]TRV52117.1 MAG: monooxygenase [Microcystis panniformis Mp_MB_F_20080800_S26D]TRV52177.1 MAG: monooxygenase [Microcystis panniformis Mp_GB_SS_20050300_S99]TRV53783.1 MAG: monooxygenase [Microcystis panniformis Mp_MB_F_20080800_S26]TRV63711.1 MAG: monooxygenase [Microcystis panniformis Mp_MB_F_20051200_S9]TRV67972.1 MAG: monooxygenase [Microcystis panniformis Mp_MB_F_20051200_S9D]TRV68540.1 MAG: monooxygenase [Microcystis pan